MGGGGGGGGPPPPPAQAPLDLPLSLYNLLSLAYRAIELSLLINPPPPQIIYVYYEEYRS